MTTYAVLTDKGSRKINEDSVGVREGRFGMLFALADGLGGHGQGEVASALALAGAFKAFESDEVARETLLPLCVAQAQNEVIDEQRRQGLSDEIKTTLCLLHIHRDIARWAHVGDSRVYAFRKDRLLARTLDHSVPQMLVAQGELRERDIRFHEDRNRLIRVLGMPWDVPKYDLSDELMIAPPMSFLLCSDGFWELIDEKEMSKILRRSSTPEEWLDMMRDVIEKNGVGKNMDNYSAIAVFAR